MPAHNFPLSFASPLANGSNVWGQEEEQQGSAIAAMLKPFLWDRQARATGLRLADGGVQSEQREDAVRMAPNY